MVYPLPNEQQQLRRLEERQIIERSISAYNTPLVVVLKKKDNSVTLVLGPKNQKVPPGVTGG